METEGFVTNAETLLLRWWWWAYFNGIDYLDAKRVRAQVESIFHSPRGDDDA